MSTFFSISETGEAFIKEKGSKFYAFAFPVEDEEAIKCHINTLKKEFYDARHHCYAWSLGLDKQRTRANDDGEPSHSAGDPILGQIKSYEITNVLVVVIRYFGGTKLGMGGLISAYRQAANAALANTKKIQVFEYQEIELSYPYDLINLAERLVSEFSLKVHERLYNETCKMKCTIKKDSFIALHRKVAENYQMQLREGG